MSFIIFIIVLSILIIVHEWGHFITAKKLGVRVEKFAVGFGPELYSWQADGTRFMICAIPLGGFVKMAGDERAQSSGQSDEFLAKPVGHRALIVLNGPVVNFIFAYLCFWFVFMIGYPDLSSRVGEVSKGYPAETAGFQINDQILSVDGNRVENWTDLQKFVSQSTAAVIQVKILRGKDVIEKSVAPKVEIRENVFGQKKQGRLLGIRPTEDIILFKYNPVESLVKAGEKIVEITVVTYKSLYFMLTGTMSAKESMTGPVGIFFIIKAAAAQGFSYLLYIMGIISASLALFNLLPMIPLDGGHIFFLGIEKLRGKPLSPKADEWIARVGVGLIICLALFVFYSDFSRLGWIDKVKALLPGPKG